MASYNSMHYIFLLYLQIYLYLSVPYKIKERHKCDGRTHERIHRSPGEGAQYLHILDKIGAP